ncbi:MAG: hypothetical protein ABI304_08345 [Rudaea sp.]
MLLRKSGSSALSWCTAVVLGVSASAAPVFASGNLDPGFGTGGEVLINFGSGSASLSYAYAVMPDGHGNVYVAGTNAADGNNYYYAIAKLGPTGALVPGFGTGGKATIIHGAGLDYISAMTQDSSGNLYLAAPTTTGTRHDFAVLKLDATGHPVAGFGSNGVATIVVGPTDNFAQAIALDGSGHVYLAGYSKGQFWSFEATKMDAATGSPVASFGNNGAVHLDIGPPRQDGFANALQLDSVGNLYLAGFTSGTTGNDFRAMKLNANGSFVDWGVDTFDIGSNSNDRVYAAALDSSNHLHMVGYTDANGGDFAAIELDTSGNLVPGYGSGGKAVYNLSTNTTHPSYSMALDGAGNAYVGVAGYSVSGNGVFAAAELDVNGNLVPNFGSGGKQTVSFGAGKAAFSNAIALDGSGHLYLAGGSGSTTNPQFAVARLLTDTIFRNGFEAH